MESNFDLDINNYNINDLLSFLKLTSDYDLNDIEQKTNEMTNELLFSNNSSSSSNDKKYKRVLSIRKKKTDTLLVT